MTSPEIPEPGTPERQLYQGEGRIASMICAALSGAVVGAVLVWVVM